jgi:hypothetical protein
MASGPEHYRRAEHAAGQAEEHLTEPGADIAAAAAWATLAQVHAALAATAAGLARHLGATFTTEEAWRDAAGLARPGRRPVIEGTTEPGGSPAPGGPEGGQQ